MRDSGFGNCSNNLPSFVVFMVYNEHRLSEA